MITCPKCQAENRLGARFCKNCAARLPDPPSNLVPPGSSSGSEDIPTKPRGKNPNSMTTRKLGSKVRTGTQPLSLRQQFIQRPPGAIFGDQFLYQTLLSSAANKFQYTVTQLDGDTGTLIRLCPNKECGAIFPPRSEPSIQFCTDCGSVLEKGGANLVITETFSPAPENILRLASKGLSHGSLRAPLAAFDEKLGGETRYCLVAPFVKETFEDRKSDPNDQAVVLGIASALGRGLEYMHDNGVHFDGQISPSNFGREDGKAVWADFSTCLHHPDGYVSDRLNDTRALAKLVFFWLTGKKDYSMDADIPHLLRVSFDPILLKTDVQTGEQFAAKMEELAAALFPPVAALLQSGRLSDVGMVRDLNEDSLMSLEWDHTKQSVKRMVGVYVVADGMGGHSSGEIASGQIISTFHQKAAEFLMNIEEQAIEKDAGKWLKSTVEAANRDVFNLRKTAGTDMGSTLVAAILIGGHAFIAHIGDSRAYLVGQHEIRQITEDHSLVQRMVAAHQITPEEARHHPQRNVIYRTIGDKPNIDVEIIELKPQAGDFLCLCSDGLSGMVDDSTIMKIIRNASTPQMACDELVKTANAAGGQDNVSVIVVKISKP